MTQDDSPLATTPVLAPQGAQVQGPQDQTALNPAVSSIQAVQGTVGNTTQPVSDPAPIVHADEVAVDGDIQAVPQEDFGLATNTLPAPVASAEPLQAPPEFVPPSTSQAPLPADEPPVAVVPPVAPSVASPTVPDEQTILSDEPAPLAPDITEESADVFEGDAVASTPMPTSDEKIGSEETASEETTESSSEEKSPLDILEEILAGAEAEKNQVSEEEKKKKDEEAEFQAQLAVKQVEYDQQAQQRLAESATQIEAAKQQRDAVDKDLMEQGKIDAPATHSGVDFTIRQLEHKKPE